MNQTESNRFGGNAAIITGFLFLVVAGFEVFAPTAENSTVAHAMHGNFFMWYHVTLSLLGLIGFAAVPAITQLARPGSFMTWTRHLAMFAFALIAADNFRQIRLDHRIAHEFMQAEPAVQKTILITWQALVELNPQALLSMLLLIFWMAVVSARLPKEGSSKRFMLYLQVGIGVALVLLVAGILLDLRILRVCAVILAAAGIPAWFVRMGISFMREGAPAR